MMYYSGNWVQIASAEKKRGSDTSLRARAEINSHFGESAGGQMRGAATQAMPDIVEDPELRSGRAPLPRSMTARWPSPMFTWATIDGARASPTGLGGLQPPQRST